jgi:uncharacterized protein
MSQVDKNKITVAVVTGRHPFDVVAFQEMWRSFPHFAVYVQHMEDYVTDTAGMRQNYDVVVFYNFHQEIPGGEQGWWEKNTLAALDQLGATGQGIMILHHALLAYKGWPLWNDLVGVEGRTFGYYMNQSLRVHVETHEHPVCAGISDFDLVDETYTMDDALEGNGNTILLTTSHEKSMKTLAWTRRCGNSNVFCWESGHDGAAFRNPTYRVIMERAINWLSSNRVSDTTRNQK